MRLTWNELLETARWSPSPHNIQPWRLRVRDTGAAELVCDAARLLPATDPSGRFSAVGLGVFIETMAIAARARATDLETELTQEPLVPNGRALIPVARLRLVEGAADAIPAALIERRRTSRLRYDGHPVEPHVLAEASRVAAEWGHTARFTSDPRVVSFALDLNRETLFFDLTDEQAREEIGRWLRFDERSAAAAGDGFSPSALGFPGWLLSLFFHHHRGFELPVVRAVVRKLYMRTMAGTATIGLLQGPFDDLDAWVRAGRMLARFWLTLTSHDVCLHPFGSVITNVDANRRMHERLTPDARHGTSWLLMRLGHSVEPPRSYRRRVDELLVR